MTTCPFSSTGDNKSTITLSEKFITSEVPDPIWREVKAGSSKPNRQHREGTVRFGKLKIGGWGRGKGSRVRLVPVLVQ